MEVALKNSYVEVAKILEILGDPYKNKLPVNVRQLFERYKDNNYQLNIDKNTNIDDLNISRNALIIIGILNLKYWEQDPVKKQELKRKYENNEREFQEKINIYKEENWLKNRVDVKNVSTKENIETSLIVQENLSIFEKIKRFFINLFHKRR